MLTNILKRIKNIIYRLFNYIMLYTAMKIIKLTLDELKYDYTDLYKYNEFCIIFMINVYITAISIIVLFGDDKIINEYVKYTIDSTIIFYSFVYLITYYEI